MQMNLPDLGGGYLGSRKEKDRYRYLKTNLAGFIELCPNRRIDKDQLKALIEEVPGVKSVVSDPKGTKMEQNHPGNHEQDRNWFVFTEACPHVGLEFEVTRSKHLKSRKHTNTVCFKPTTAAYVLEAWRVLRRVCAGRELCPDKVNEWHEEVRAMYSEGGSGMGSTGQSDAAAPAPHPCSTEQRVTEPAATPGSAGPHAAQPMPPGVTATYAADTPVPASGSTRPHATEPMPSAVTASTQPPVPATADPRDTGSGAATVQAKTASTKRLRFNFDDSEVEDRPAPAAPYAVPHRPLSPEPDWDGEAAPANAERLVQPVQAPAPGSAKAEPQSLEDHVRSRMECEARESDPDGTGPDEELVQTDRRELPAWLQNKTLV